MSHKRVTNLFDLSFIQSDWPRWEYDWGQGVCRIVYTDKSLGFEPTRKRSDEFTDETFFIQNVPPNELWYQGFADWFDGITREHPKAKPLVIANTVEVENS